MRRDKRGRFLAISATTITAKGYVRITAGPQRGAYLHRLLAEFKVGRRLDPGEDTHHVNGHKLDFGYENLTVLDHGQHSALEAQQRRNAKHREPKQLTLVEMYGTIAIQ